MKNPALAMLVATALLLPATGAAAQESGEVGGGRDPDLAAEVDEQIGNDPVVAPDPDGVVRVQPPPPPCRYFPGRTGREMAAYAATWSPPLFPGPPPADQVALHAEDDAGRWFAPDCQYPDDSPLSALEQLTARTNWINSNPWVWNAAPPPPPIPVADLIVYARDVQSIPRPVVGLNPEGETVTGLRTWVWPTGPTLDPVVAEARDPNYPQLFARLTATPGRLSLAADAGDVGPCTAPLVWSAGQPDDATDCFVTFRRSSAGLPGGEAEIDVQVEWTVVLETSDGIGNGVVDSVVVTTQESIGVAQVQSVLR